MYVVCFHEVRLEPYVEMQDMDQQTCSNGVLEEETQRMDCAHTHTHTHTHLALAWCHVVYM